MAADKRSFSMGQIDMRPVFEKVVFGFIRTNQTANAREILNAMYDSEPDGLPREQLPQWRDFVDKTTFADILSIGDVDPTAENVDWIMIEIMDLLKRSNPIKNEQLEDEICSRMISEYKVDYTPPHGTKRDRTIDPSFKADLKDAIRRLDESGSVIKLDRNGKLRDEGRGRWSYLALAQKPRDEPVRRSGLNLQIPTATPAADD